MALLTDSPDIYTDDVYAPSLKLRANLSAFAPNVPDSIPDDAGHYEPNTSRSNFHYAVSDESYKPTLLRAGETASSAAPVMPAANPYAARLTDIGNQLQSAYAAPHAGMARQVLGALLSRKNPQLGGLVSGETQRERTIEPLQQEYGLLSNIIAANRAQQTADITNQLHTSQAKYFDTHANVLENPVAKPTPQEQAVQDYMSRINPATKKNYTPAEALKQVNQDAQDVKPSTQKQGLDYDPGTGIPISYNDANGQKWDVNDPNLPPEGKKLVSNATTAHKQHVQEQADAQARAAANASQRQQQTFSRQDVKEHDKDYVLPAEQIERSYQMYKEAQDAFNRGDAKTGAASMLALSQHLGTTFGQVKGSRMNRDLIQEHKDAIGWEDRIERFIENAKTGQQLAPDQIKEFGDLISNMRKLTWQMAAKEANRKHIPVDFLPNDLSGIAGGSSQSTSSNGVVRNSDGSVDWKATLGIK